MLRIISQDRLVDFPYEDTIIELSEDKESKAWGILAHHAAAGVSCVLGEYSTKEAAQMEMARLRNAFLACNNKLDCDFVANEVHLFSPDRSAK